MGSEIYNTDEMRKQRKEQMRIERRLKYEQRNEQNKRELIKREKSLQKKKITSIIKLLCLGFILYALMKMKNIFDFIQVVMESDQIMNEQKLSILEIFSQYMIELLERYDNTHSIDLFNNNNKDQKKRQFDWYQNYLITFLFKEIVQIIMIFIVLSIFGYIEQIFKIIIEQRKCKYLIGLKRITKNTLRLLFTRNSI